MAVPPGVDPNDSRQPLVIGVISMLLVLAFTSVALRVYTRAVIVKAFGWDDAAAIFALGVTFASGFCVAWNTRYGLGKHVYFLGPEEIKLYLRTFYLSIVFYNAALFATKLTFLLQYWRVIAIQNMRKIFYVAMFIVLGWGISAVFVEIFICKPISAFWDPKGTPGKCIPNLPQWYINAAGNIITDLIVFILPLPVIGKLNLAKGQKYSLLGIFCLGFFTCALSVVRIKFLKLTEDATWDNVEAACWSIAELCSGVICASLLTLRPILARVVPSLSSRAKSSNQYVKHPSSGRNKPHEIELNQSWRNLNNSGSKDVLYSESHFVGQDSESERTPWRDGQIRPVRSGLS